MEQILQDNTKYHNVDWEHENNLYWHPKSKTDDGYRVFVLELTRILTYEESEEVSIENYCEGRVRALINSKDKCYAHEEDLFILKFDMNIFKEDFKEKARFIANKYAKALEMQCFYIVTSTLESGHTVLNRRRTKNYLKTHNIKSFNNKKDDYNPCSIIVLDSIG